VKPFFFGLVLVLAGCASQPGPPVAATAFDPELPEYSAWSIRGRVSLVRGEQGWHARMNWHEAAGHYRLNLSGPLGQGALQISGAVDGMVRLQTADGRQYAAADADALVLSVTGWQLPVTELRYWVRGVPVPGEDAGMTADGQGRLARLQQSGWDITYNRYREHVGRGWPTRMRLEAADISVTLVIDEWTVSPPVTQPAGLVP
jgi:outer membrane lipoprotein LolB